MTTDPLAELKALGFSDAEAAEIIDVAQPADPAAPAPSAPEPVKPTAPTLPDFSALEGATSLQEAVSLANQAVTASRPAARVEPARRSPSDVRAALAEIGDPPAGMSPDAQREYFAKINTTVQGVA